jgi:hypothetical protein
MTSHSTAFFRSTFSTVSTLLTVFGARFVRRRFTRCTSSFVIASSRFDPSSGIRCARVMESLAAIPLGFC